MVHRPVPILKFDHGVNAMVDQFSRRQVHKAVIAVAMGLAASRLLPPAPVRLFDFAVAGGWHHGLGTVRKTMLPGEVVDLIAEPGNPYDEFAVRVVRRDGTMLGYVPRAANRPVAELLAVGRRVEAVVVETLRFARDEEIPDDFAFTGFTNGDPRLRLYLVG